MLTVLLLCVFAFANSIESKGDFVITPFGIRRRECVIEVDHESNVRTLPHGDLEITNGLKKSVFSPPSHCGDDIEQIRNKFNSKRQIKSQNYGGWLDYGGWYPPPQQSNLASFTSTYTVPGNPINMQGSQVLFYFIGMQDNDAPNAVNIIQPVLTWGNGYNQWYIKSWACCPSNITVSSPAVFGPGPGSLIQGVVTRISPSTWRIVSTWNGQSTTLNAQVGDYNYNWADVTLEVYTISSCNDFATGRAVFNQLVLKDAQGQTLNPQWQFTGQTQCNGVIQQTSPTSIYIQHSV